MLLLFPLELGDVPCMCVRGCTFRAAVACVHGEVRCDPCSGRAVRAALTPAPFAPRAALFFLRNLSTAGARLAPFLKVL